MNACPPNRLLPYNLDGRAFIRKLVEGGVRYHHAIMNLPASAPEFLDAFRGRTFQRRGDRDSEKEKEEDDSGDYHRPRVHVHCFGGKDEESDNDAIKRCERALGCSLDSEADSVTVRIVRDVSPKKNMLCVSFSLPLGVRDVPPIDIDGEVAGAEAETRKEEGRGKGQGLREESDPPQDAKRRKTE